MGMERAAETCMQCKQSHLVKVVVDGALLM